MLHLLINVSEILVIEKCLCCVLICLVMNIYGFGWPWVVIFLLYIRGVTFGGKGSTDYAVKGLHKEVPEELIDELKAICQVL